VLEETGECGPECSKLLQTCYGVIQFFPLQNNLPLEMFTTESTSFLTVLKKLLLKIRNVFVTQ
jgi:hypothetical protein